MSRLSPATALILVGLAAALVGAAPPPELGPQGMVASDHADASAAGASVLELGGNAVDAAVATALAAGVVQPAGSGLGGGGFAVVLKPDGQRHVLDFREVAPAAADRDLFVRAAEAGDDDASQTGGLAVAVPAEGLGLVELHERLGRLSLKRVVAPAVRLARSGFTVGAHLSHAFEGLEDRADPLAALLFEGRSAAPKRGEAVRRLRLARTLDSLARTRGKVLRDGWVADDFVASAAAQGGILSAQDLADYQVRDREPLVGQYRDWTVTTMPPPSSGGAVLLAVLGVLEAFEPAQLGDGSSELWHLMAEAMQHAYADRAHFMGDPDRVEVPLQAMLAPERLLEVQRSILPSRTFPADHYGLPVDIGQDAGTQHISVLDDDGMAVALTTTVNTSFGSKVIGSATGVVLNNEMDDFVARPGVPNAYGLVGSDANAVAPGARPLSSMTPTVLEHADGRRIVIGASGGPFIISATLQVIVGIVDLGLDPAEAVSRPRMHHQWQPQLLFVDEGTTRDVIAGLSARGHQVKEIGGFSSVQVVMDDGAGNVLGASDPRKGGWPKGAW